MAMDPLRNPAIALRYHCDYDARLLACLSEGLCPNGHTLQPDHPSAVWWPAQPVGIGGDCWACSPPRRWQWPPPVSDRERKGDTDG